MNWLGETRAGKNNLEFRTKTEAAETRNVEVLKRKRGKEL
jgi:hypothetical protein